MIALTNVFLFLVSFIFDFYIIVLILHLLIQKLEASYHNLVSQFVIRVTSLFVAPLQHIIPEFHGFDFSIVFLIIVFEFIQAFLLFWLRSRLIPHFGGLLLISIGALGNKCMSLYFYAIIFRIIISWVVSLQQSPAAEIIFLITDPVMKLIRRFIPAIAGFDAPALLLLMCFPLISFLFFDPLMNVGMRLALM
ncbi:MAG: YggT family protein [Coxiella-like endosymbiont]|uniref:YggT family protein n=1 Tax=Coxiella-like endosymbiont TaxID=1592897 RepID=UPI00215B26DC|nr:YggT family protein [Coxiella-like endosymbiont]UVE59420.1 YggT family protein [Coxiella-like endosymbiont]